MILYPFPLVYRLTLLDHPYEKDGEQHGIERLQRQISRIFPIIIEQKAHTIYRVRFFMILQIQLQQSCEIAAGRRCGKSLPEQTVMGISHIED